MEKLKEMAASLAVDHLLPPLKKAVKSVMEIPKDVADMEDKLDKIQAMIHAADKMAAAEEDNSSRDEMKAKVKQMVETSFRMEDFIDEYTINEEKKLGDDPGCEALPCKAIDFFKTMASRLQFAYLNEDAKSEFPGIKDKNKSEGAGSQGDSSGGNQNPTFLYLREAPFNIGEAEVVGFDGARDELIGWLVSGESDRTVISVVAMGGQGKTTLAKKVFDNKRVMKHFQCHAWITVSQSYTVEGLLKDMLQKLCKEKNKNPPENISAMDRLQLRNEVKECLHDKRYVVVFDDIWNVDFCIEMELALIDNKKGSRVFITTRNKQVALSFTRFAHTEVHELQPLTHEQSLKLFYKKAFGYDLKGDCPNNLKVVSNEIVKKCKGLPLAIVAIGGVLSSPLKRDPCKWKKFCNTLSRELEKDPHLSPVTKILSFSYHDLPYYLKPCFLYLGIYPEDYEIECWRLIPQWIAEGFVKSEATEALEEEAEQYLNELIHRSLIQVSSFTKGGKVKICRVHDLVREMICEKIEDLSFCHFASRPAEKTMLKSGMIRRLIISSDSNKLIGSVENSNIRSLHVFREEDLSESLEKSMPRKYKSLRVLHFEGASLYNYVPLTKNLEDLSRLRYLSFRNSEIVNLPKSIGELHNLETLDVRQTRVSKMPREIYKLKKLKHLLGYKDSEGGFVHGLEMEGGIGDLTSLETLRDVEADHDTEELMKGLERLSQLRVLGLANVERGFTSFLCSLINKMQHMEKLYITARSDKHVIDLQFDVSAPALQKVHILGDLKEFPNWVAKLQNLVTLSLSFCGLDDDPLPLLKDLPNLSSLYILRFAYMGEVLQFPNKGFQNLRQILMRRLFPLKSIIIEDGALPSLKKFELSSIPKLTEVPSGLYKLPKLEVFHVTYASPKFKKNFHLNREQSQCQWILIE